MFKKILAGFLLLGVIGCQDGFIDEGEARIRAVALSPDSGNVDVFHNDESVLLNAPYTTSTGYVRIPGGIKTVKVRASGTTPILQQTTFDFLGGGRYTYALVGMAASLEGVIFADPTGSPIPTQGAIRVFHASPASGAFDIFVTAPGAPLALETPIATNVAYKSVTSFALRTAGDFQVRATNAGTLVEVFTSATVTLAGGTKRTAFLIEAAGGGLPLGMVFLQD